MKAFIWKAIFFVVILVLFVQQAVAQSTDTTKSKAPSRKLPQISLEAYTIVGLEKITLPKKHRKKQFKPVATNWIVNPGILEKEKATLQFRLPPRKSGLIQFYNFPWLEAMAGYGNYQRLELGLKTQWVVNNFLPHMAGDYLQHEGHKPNAGRTEMHLQGGFQFLPWSRTALSLGTDYSQIKQGYWGKVIPADSSWEARHSNWRFQGELWQQISTNVAFSFSGNQQQFEQEVSNHYQINSLDLQSGILWKLREVRIQTGLEYEQQKADKSSGLVILNRDSSYTNRITSAYLKGGYPYKSFFVELGVRYQSPELASGDNSRAEVFPSATLRFSSGEFVHVMLKYDQGYELPDAEQLVKQFFYADFKQIQPTRFDHHMIGTLLLKPISALQLKYSTNYWKGKNYPVLFSNMPTLSPATPGLPRWEYRFQNAFQLIMQEVEVSWRVLPTFFIRGGITLSSARASALDENQRYRADQSLPYIPEVATFGEMQWMPVSFVKLIISGNYLGRRYDDFGNTISLNPYSFLNSEMQLKIREGVYLLVLGRNLLNQSYEPYYSMDAPPINGSVQLKVKF